MDGSGTLIWALISAVILGGAFYSGRASRQLVMPSPRRLCSALECQLILPDHHASYGGDRETSAASYQCFIPVCADDDNASTRETLDLAKITCKQFTGNQLPPPSRDIVLMLTGYYHAKRNNTIIEFQTIKKEEEPRYAA